VLAVYGLYVSTQIGVGSQTTVDQDMSFGGLPGGDTQSAMSNVSLVDPVGLKQYLTYTAQPSAPNMCVCSLAPDISAYNRGALSYYAAVTSAPPPSVTSVSFVTGIGTIGNVSLSG
jgi:hypothetical protein